MNEMRIDEKEMEKQDNGKYCVIYRYQDKDGKKKQKWETFDRREDLFYVPKGIVY